MKSGLQTLHEIDRAIGRARSAVADASRLPKQNAEALIELRRQQSTAYSEIAEQRLILIEEGEGGELGYIDRKAGKLLEDHEKVQKQQAVILDKAVVRIEALEKERRKLESDVSKAVDAYDKATAKAEKEILLDPAYQEALDNVEQAEGRVIRSSAKLDIARKDEKEKGKPYRSDPFFNYLQKHKFGTRDAKGWALTKMLDSWVARKIKYRNSAENYNRLRAIPERLENHVKSLEEDVFEARDGLEELEAEILKKKGVTALHKASLDIQAELDALDEKIEGAEREYETARSEHQRLAAGEVGPYQEAVEIISEGLKRVKYSDLRRLAAQTTSRSDDQAIEDIRDLARAADELEDDQKEARSVIKKYERTLKELEAVRRRFKSRRYDAPSSVFDNDLVGAILLQVLAGAVTGDNLWRQIERAQRTIRRYSDNDFGGVDWTEGLRLPRTTRSRRSPRVRTSIPRSPRISLPRSSPSRRSPSRRSSGSRSGGFRTGGGF